jgi:predicted AlkP superfamily pyrophosphatase or phosphodiesterase
MNKIKSVLLILAAALLTASVGIFYSACQRSNQPPVILLGVDGLEWDVLLPLLKDQRMPNTAGLMERGYYGELETLHPTLSPVIWTSVATAKVRDKHRIYGFVRPLPDGSKTLFNNSNRIVKALWNILSDYGRRVHTIGWWMTYPVDKIKGIMVAQTNTTDQINAGGGEHVWKGMLVNGVKGQVYPPRRQNEMLAIAKQVSEELPDLTKKIFGEFRHPLSLLDERLWDNCIWSFRADTIYHRISLTLAQENPQPDLMMIYFGGTDVVSHRFWRYMQPEIFKYKPTPEQIANLGTVIVDYYIYLDRMLGQLLEKYETDVTVILVSDHGFQPVNLDLKFDPDAPPSEISSGDHKDAPPGIFIAAGPKIRNAFDNEPLQSLKREDIKRVGSVLDVTPTVLALMGIPVGMDMDGRVIKRIFTKDFLADYDHDVVDTHDTPEFLASRPKGILSPTGEEQRLEQLRSLGYIDSKKKDQPR